MYEWFKVYHDMPDDIKLRRFKPSEKWGWVALLCLASKSKDRGIIEAEDDDISEYCEFNSTEDWFHFRNKLISKGMIELLDMGKIQILHWGDRQYKNPSGHPDKVKERVAKHRAAKKAELNPEISNDNVTTNNLSVTTSNDNVTTQTRLDQIRSEEIRSDQIVSLESEKKVFVDTWAEDRLAKQKTKTDVKAMLDDKDFLTSTVQKHLDSTSSFKENKSNLANARDWVRYAEKDPVRYGQALDRWQGYLERQKTGNGDDFDPKHELWIQQIKKGSAIANEFADHLRSSNPQDWTAFREFYRTHGAQYAENYS